MRRSNANAHLIRPDSSGQRFFKKIQFLGARRQELSEKAYELLQKACIATPSAAEMMGNHRDLAETDNDIFDQYALYRASETWPTTKSSSWRCGLGCQWPSRYS